MPTRTCRPGDSFAEKRRAHRHALFHVIFAYAIGAAFVIVLAGSVVMLAHAVHEGAKHRAAKHQLRL